MVTLASVSIYRYVFVFGDCSTAADYCMELPVGRSFAYDNPAIQLGIQNILNPAALTAEKALIRVRNGSIIVISLLQFSLTYLSIFLFALATRTQFQKGSGGDR